MTNLALVADPSNAATMRFDDAGEPRPAPDQAVVDVSHAGLNHGDLNDAVSGRIPPGGVLGSDVAGVVVRAAADGSGPAAGQAVVGLAVGGWAQRVAVDAGSLALVPSQVPLDVAAALPVAGLAALRTLTASGPLSGRRVLVTGASGGVGSFAVQIAAGAGAQVIASVGSEHRAEGLAELGADEVLVGLDSLSSPVDVVIDSVGGPQLVQAWGLLAPGGHLHSVGWTSGAVAQFPPYSTVGPAKTLSSYLTHGLFGDDLAQLVALVAEGRISVRLGWRGPWTEFEEATTSLRERRIDGKAVFDVDARA